MTLKEGKIVSLLSKNGIFVIEQTPHAKGGTYGVHDYNDKYHLFFVKESDILPVRPNYCWHQFKTIDVGLQSSSEIRYCGVCGIKYEDLERLTKD